MATHITDPADGVLVTLSLTELLTTSVAQAINAGIDHETIRGTFIAIAHDDGFWTMTGRVQESAERDATAVMGDMGDAELPTN